MAWFKKKKECVHCRENKTRRDFEGHPTCVGCQVKVQISRESKRNCPVDGTELVKGALNAIVIDRCPKCEGVWLDAGELKAIKTAANEEGMGAGMVMGMVIG